MNKKLKIERVDLFGEIRKITYDTDRKEFQGVGFVNSRDVSRLFEKIAEHYVEAKSKRGKRIAEISAELAKLVKEDGDFHAETHSYIVDGASIVLKPDVKVIQPKNEY